MPKRDVNGNVKSPIGTDIDDIKAKVLYERDPAHKEKLKKLAFMRKKSGFLYRKGTLARKGSE